MNTCKTLLLIGLFVILNSCFSDNEAQKIIDLSIAAHGGERFQRAEISFDFRDRHYEIFKSPERFRYLRSFRDESGMVEDVLDNSGFVRKVNGREVTLPADKENAYANSVNSVAYFAFLPYGLNDEAVIKQYLGETQLENQPYYLIKVTFRQKGGGEDHEDEFLYWIHQEHHRMDYLAYTYHTDGGGIRFRKATNTHDVSGILLQDYDNYKPEDESLPVESMQELFEAGELELLSQILLENVQVRLVD
ncbi:hypothetical protein SAMN04488057_11920 [Cyclobacterium lianum]|uniref:Deoxyribose-phosphate aldolase n=1 Tax=Cyclobacterium lianum TaxID=388280 RepID=A0A1M7QJJ0_9BACT|nr:DUF6503 family protein [Cyclobacterium lianum]SHN31373.1 hypothetical protein SAMN04488057_11920 [Cyclobacterium lianum]